MLGADAPREDTNSSNVMLPFCRSWPRIRSILWSRCNDINPLVPLDLDRQCRLAQAPLNQRPAFIRIRMRSEPYPLPHLSPARLSLKLAIKNLAQEKPPKD